MALQGVSRQSVVWHGTAWRTIFRSNIVTSKNTQPEMGCTGEGVLVRDVGVVDPGRRNEMTPGPKKQETMNCIRTNIGRCEGKQCSPECAQDFLGRLFERILDSVADEVAHRVAANFGQQSDTT